MAQPLKISILLDGPFVDDLRVSREAKTLADAGYDITLYGVKDANLPDETVIDGVKVKRIMNMAGLLNFKSNTYYEQIAAIIAQDQADVLHCHDHFMLHMGAEVKKLNPKAVLIYDSHELFRYQPTNLKSKDDFILKLKTKIVRFLQNRRERINGRNSVDYLITVNTSLAEDLQQYFRLKEKPVVTRNVPEWEEVHHSKDHLREEFNLSADTKILVFIGRNVYIGTLNLEQVIDEFANKDKVALIFIAGKEGGRNFLQNYVKEKGIMNVFFRDTVPAERINEFLCFADAGLVPTWNKTDISYWLALDNKLFHYISAEIPVLATKQPEYVKIVDTYKVGVTINPEEKDAYINGFHQINARPIAEWKVDIIAAKKQLQWSIEQEQLLDLYKRIEVLKTNKP